MSSRFDTEESEKYSKELAKGAAPNWRVTSRMPMTDDLFKTIVAAEKGRANIHRTESNSGNLKVYHTDVNANRVRVTKDRRLYKNTDWHTYEIIMTSNGNIVCKLDSITI